MVLRIGLTGGIGSGKTTVSNRFRHLGIAVIDADELAHALSKKGQEAYLEIAHTFGPDILQSDGELDRAKLRSIVFNNPEQRKQLEAILHPRIRMEMYQQAEQAKSPYCVLVIPLLIENELEEMVDRILVIDAFDERRIEWITIRSGLSEGEIRRIFESQVSREQRLAAADDVIENSRTIPDLTNQVDRLHQEYLELASSH